MLGTSGRFHQLVKNSNQRRNNKVTKENTTIEIERNYIVQKKIIQRLEEKMEEFEERIEDGKINSERLQSLFEAGIIDSKGNPIDTD